MDFVAQPTKGKFVLMMSEVYSLPNVISHWRSGSGDVHTLLIYMCKKKKQKRKRRRRSSNSNSSSSNSGNGKRAKYKHKNRARENSVYTHIRHKRQARIGRRMQSKYDWNKNNARNLNNKATNDSNETEPILQRGRKSARESMRLIKRNREMSDSDIQRLRVSI